MAGMERTKYLRIMFVLAVMGFLFSGYLTFSRLLLQTCPLNEPCAIFLGLPTCVYGFVMFTLMLIFSAIGAFHKKAHHVCMTKADMVVSLIGILFAGFFTIKELFFTQCVGGPCKYSLGLPSCTYGLVFFIAIFVLSIMSLSRKDAPAKKRR
jgi:uncharacterized membrane protein